VRVEEILRENEALPREQRRSVLEAVRRLVEPEIPASFKKRMERIKRGERIELDDVLQELDEACALSSGTPCGTWTSAPTRFTVLDTENMTFSFIPFMKLEK
jgi:hypothetical protein